MCLYFRLNFFNILAILVPREIPVYLFVYHHGRGRIAGPDTAGHFEGKKPIAGGLSYLYPQFIFQYPDDTLRPHRWQGGSHKPG